MPKARKAALDAATGWLVELRGGLSHKHSRDYWRFSTKAELCGQVEAGERFVQGIKDAFAKNGEVSISFLPGSGKWNEKLATTLIADAKQGDADADQVLREVAAEYLKADEKPPKPLAHYAGTCLWPPPGRKKARQQPNSSKPQSHKTDYRDWILALTVDDIVRHFKLNPALRHFKLKHTRNEATEEHCACSIVALAAKRSAGHMSERTVENAWHRYQGIADQRTATNYVPQAMISVTANGAQRHFMVRFPRVGSTRPKPQRKRKKVEH